MDSFSLEYEEIKWTYTEFDRNDEPERDHSFYWNLLENTGETDELPPGSFRVSGGETTTQAGDVLKLRWNGFEEFVYRIRGSETVDGNYGFIQDYTPAADGAQELELPLNLPKMFIQIEKLPLPQ